MLLGLCLRTMINFVFIMQVHAVMMWISAVSAQLQSNTTESRVQTNLDFKSQDNDLFNQHFSNLSTVPKTEGKKFTTPATSIAISICCCSKVVNLWNGLSDRELDRLKEEILNSLGIRKLVSDDDGYLMGLALAEIIENLESVMRSSTRLGKRCTNPRFQHFEYYFDDSTQNDVACCKVGKEINSVFTGGR
ncbi:hypothetical protein PVL29_023423 [Vitis rotundifolia]|uniref:DUF3475 domain-containing protein n=1 Tax=Vitis rotundifolia TaxID=103349 RepID=A0AA38YNR5_VITRO|nr:hypothetical protein PVL29_023423 [Vitis rotundifolia]